MKKIKIVKSREEDADASSSFLQLPVEIIFLILNKVIDLKTLCFCYLVSRHFSLLVLKVDAISFAAHFLNPRIPKKKLVPPISSSFYGESFLYAIKFLSKFKTVKSISIELPSSSEMGDDKFCSFKWIAKFGNRIESCNKIESFTCLSPISVFDTNGLCVKGNEEDQGYNHVTCSTFRQIYYNSFHIATLWHTMLLKLVKNLPMLEKVSITDLGKSGRLSLSGEKLSKVKEWMNADPETVFNCEEHSCVVSHSYMPVLKLPVSGYVMKGVYVIARKIHILEGDLVISKDGFEDEEEAAYSEALMEVWRRRRAYAYIEPPNK